ncbi:MAG: hypothetical protein ACREV8_02610, partial [Gammaproteobacteria bacterium]
GIPASQPEDFFQQVLITFLPFWPHAQVVLDGAAYDGLVEEIGHTLPWLLRVRLCNRVGTTLRERRERLVANNGMLLAEGTKVLPESHVFEWCETVVGEKRRDLRIPDQSDH